MEIILKAMVITLSTLLKTVDHICLILIPQAVIYPIFRGYHYIDVITSTMASQITSLTIVHSTVYSGADQSKHQSSAPLAFVRVIHRGTGEFSAQMASNAENVSTWWRHHA